MVIRETHDFIPCKCPLEFCDVKYFHEGVNKPFCKYPDIHASLIFDEQWDEIDNLKKRVCDYICQEMIQEEYIQNKTTELKHKFLKEAKVGDTIYCSGEFDEVVLLKKPKNIFGRCEYATKDGKIKKLLLRYFINLQKT